MIPHQIEYYRKRAKEYDLIYQKPERQNDLSKIREYLKQNFFAQHLIEIACGTGYWTVELAKKAQRIFGIDINRKQVAIKYVKVSIFTGICRDDQALTVIGPS